MEHVGPGPIDPSLLRLQAQHVSTKVCNGNEYEFRARYNFWDHLPDERVQQVIRQTAFHNVLNIGAVDINNHLITALIERWRPETHTFHLPSGECTVTLEDVAVQLGIPINGQVVTGSTSLDWENVCINLLGAVPPRNKMKGQRIKLTWLERTFSQLPPDPNEEVIIQHARAFILRMICGFLMPDTSGNLVHLMYLPLLANLPATRTYSWGSAVLAHLYRGLSRAALLQDTENIGGCMLLLQSWAYDRLPVLAPRLKNDSINYFPLVRRWSAPLITTNISGPAANIIRALIDHLRMNEFVWTPYTWMNIPKEVHLISRARVSMVCFAVAAWHPVDRVMRQFGFQQSIPDEAPVFDELYKKDLRGKQEVYWPQRHAAWITCWDNWEHYLIDGIPSMNNNLYHYSQYMQWYLTRTRRYISTGGAYSTGGFSFAKQIYDWTTPPDALDNPQQALQNCNFASRDMMEALAELNPHAYSLDFTEAASTQQFNMHEYEDEGQQPNAEINIQSPQYQEPYDIGGCAHYTHEQEQHEGINLKQKGVAFIDFLGVESSSDHDESISRSDHDAL